MELIYYTLSNISKNRFYQIPMTLITGQQYRKLNNNVRIIYGILLNRVQLSATNKQFIDDDGRIFIIYTQEEMATLLGISIKTVRAAYESLEQIGLLQRVEVQSTFKKYHKLFLGQPNDNEDEIIDICTEDLEEEEMFSRPGKNLPALGKNVLTAQQKTPLSKNNISNTEPTKTKRVVLPGNGLGLDIKPKEKPKPKSWTDVTLAFYDKHNELFLEKVDIRAKYENADGKFKNTFFKGPLAYVKTFFEERGYNCDTALEIIPRLLEILRNDGHTSKEYPTINPFNLVAEQSKWRFDKAFRKLNEIKTVDKNDYVPGNRSNGSRSTDEVF